MRSYSISCFISISIVLIKSRIENVMLYESRGWSSKTQILDCMYVVLLTNPIDSSDRIYAGIVNVIQLGGLPIMIHHISYMSTDL